MSTHHVTVQTSHGPVQFHMDGLGPTTPEDVERLTELGEQMMTRLPRQTPEQAAKYEAAAARIAERNRRILGERGA